MNINLIKINEDIEKLIPPITKEEYDILKDSIAKEGIRESLVVASINDGEDILIDGHNRVRAMKELGKSEAMTLRKNFDSLDGVYVWIIQNQLGRRNLSIYHRVELTKRLAEILKAKGIENKIEGGKTKEAFVNNDRSLRIDTRQERAKVAGVSTGTVAKVEKIEKEATEEQKQALRNGDVSISKVYEEIKETEEVDNEEDINDSFKRALDPVKEEFKKVSKRLDKKATKYIPRAWAELYNEVKAIAQDYFDLVGGLNNMAVCPVCNGTKKIQGQLLDDSVNELKCEWCDDDGMIPGSMKSIIKKKVDNE